jgi:hypothetical protein
MDTREVSERLLEYGVRAMLSKAVATTKGKGKAVNPQADETANRKSKTI